MSPSTKSFHYKLRSSFETMDFHNDMTELLLEEQPDDIKSSLFTKAAEPNMPSRKHDALKHTCLLFGIFIGFFVECGALTTHMIYKGRMDDLSNLDIVTLSLTWATVIALLPCLALMMLKRIVLLTHESDEEEEEGDASLQVLADKIWCIECFFALGNFGGVTLSALAADYVFGMRHHAVLSAILFSAFLLVLIVQELNMEEDEEKVVVEHEYQDVIDYEPAVVVASSLKRTESVDPEGTKDVCANTVLL